MHDLVTHDQREALEMGDRVAVMSEGRIEQIDTPQIVYGSPANEFVARFLGRVNVFSTDLGDTCGPLIRETQVEVMVRPEDISVRPLNEAGPLGNGQVPGKVTSYTFLGRTVRLEVQLRTGRLVTVAVPKQKVLTNTFEPGTPVVLTMGSCQVFPANGHVQSDDKNLRAIPGREGVPIE